MEQHTTLKAEHEALTSAHKQMAIELDRAVSERKTWKEECERQTEMVRAKQDNLEQCTVMLMLMRSMEETQVEPAAPEPDASVPAAAAAEAQRLALEQRCAKLEAELAALRARLQEAEASETVVAEVPSHPSAHPDRPPTRTAHPPGPPTHPPSYHPSTHSASTVATTHPPTQLPPIHPPATRPPAQRCAWLPLVSCGLPSCSRGRVSAACAGARGARSPASRAQGGGAQAGAAARGGGGATPRQQP